MNDTINGLFELFGMFFIMPSILKLVHDKQVKGVSWVHASFFSVWGIWNLYYYPSLGQWNSFLGGIGIVTVNTIWVGLMIYYSRGQDDFDKP